MTSCQLLWIFYFLRSELESVCIYCTNFHAYFKCGLASSAIFEVGRYNKAILANVGTNILICILQSVRSNFVLIIIIAIAISILLLLLLSAAIVAIAISCLLDGMAGCMIVCMFVCMTLALSGDA